MCGIFGITDNKDAARLTYLSLFALQHRGQESAGIASTLNGQMTSHSGMGIASDVFSEKEIEKISGSSAIGHVRYSTTGSSHIKNAQPFVSNTRHGALALAHNGNLTNAVQIRKNLEEAGSIFHSSTDSEAILHLLAHHPGNLEEALIKSLKTVEGAYSLLILTPEKMIACRDPYGFRPLVLGKLEDSYVVSSETTALSLIKATYLREIEPGEIVFIESGKLRSVKPFSQRPLSRCIFELVYFSRPDSVVFHESVQAVRQSLGRALAREMNGIKADLVIPVPDSGVPAALGFSRESGIPFEIGLVRSHYISRTFIKPNQEMRELAVDLKLSPVSEALKGKKIILVDDSIVRGTTSRKITKSLRSAGTKEIHMAITSPPIISACYYGIDTPQSEALIANQRSIEEIRKFLDVDSLHYLSLDAMRKAASQSSNSDSTGFCDACFTKNYPTPLPQEPLAGKLSS